MQLKDLKNKKTALWGLGKEGEACKNFLVRHGLVQELTIFEKDEDVNLEGIEVLIKSPGVSLYKDEIVQFKSRGGKVTSSSDLFFSEMRANHPNKKIIAISGSKGKSTSVSILAHMLKNLGCKTALGGNIGKPLIELLDEDFDFAVCEVSSYQASDLSASPHIAMFTNLYYVHSDWHHGHEQYCKDKLHLVANQKPGDVFFINAKNPQSLEYTQEMSAGKQFYNQPENFHAEGKTLYFQKTPLLSMADLKLSGDHNLDNLAGVFSILKCLGIDIFKAAEAAKSFEPLPHRLQKVRILNGVAFINDSISTAPEAAIGGMKSFDGNIAIISGGQDNQQDYTDYAEYINQNAKIKMAVTLFQTGPKIASVLRRHVTRNDFELSEAESLQQAVQTAYNKLKSLGGGIVLFSPTSPSFGFYKNFMERVQDFIDIVNKLS